MKADEQKTILRLVEVARLYYEQGHTQTEIASILGISRPLVSGLLQAARDRGIVKIEIRSPLENDDVLLRGVVDKFGLEGGIVVPADGDNLSLSLKTLVSQASKYIAGVLSDSESIGFGWGGLVATVVDSLRSENIRPNGAVHVCPLIGSMSAPAIDWHPNEMVRRFSEHFAMDAAFIHAPAFPANSTDFNVFRATEEYLQIQSRWNELSTAVVGIETYPSVPDQATATRFGDILRRRDAVGGLLSYFFNVSGELIEGSSDYVIRIPFDNLKKVPNVVLICSGNTKIEALIGALNLGVVTQLVTDDRAASQLLSYSG